MPTIKHWGQRYDAVQENICSEMGCFRQAEHIVKGQPKCDRCYSIVITFRGRDEFARPLRTV